MNIWAELGFWEKKKKRKGKNNYVIFRLQFLSTLEKIIPFWIIAIV